MRAILIGAGGISRELLQRLGEMWDVTVLDGSPDRLGRCEGIRPFRSFTGDGSSRVALQRAGLDEADALIAATEDDDVNLEACRLARETGIPRVSAVANDPDRLSDYKQLGVTAIPLADLAARRIELALETRRVESTAFAGGLAEAIEFRVAEDSAVCGRALHELRARSWIVGSLLRDSQLVIPHGETVLKIGDLVTVVGAGADFGEIVRSFTSGEGRFPLSFGKRVAVALEGEQTLNGTFSEALHLARNTKASSLLMIHRDPASIAEEVQQEEIRDLLHRAAEQSNGVDIRPKPVKGRPARAMRSLPEDESVGVLVFGAGNGKRGPGWRKAARAVALVRETGRPVLLSRGTHPYGKILVPARRTRAGRAAVRAAVDLARFTKAELDGIAVVDPIFIAGSSDLTEERRAISWLEEEAAVHGVGVHGTLERGNPVRIIRRLAADADLLVLGVGGRKRRLAVQVGVAELVARTATQSVLLVPVVEPS